MKKTNAISVGLMATSTLLTTLALTGAQNAEAKVRKPFASADEITKALEAMKFRTNTTLLEGFENVPVEAVHDEASDELIFEEVSSDSVDVQPASWGGSRRQSREYWENEPQFTWEEVETATLEEEVETFDDHFPRHEVQAALEQSSVETPVKDAEISTAAYDSSEGWNVQAVRRNANTSSMEKQILQLVNSERLRRGMQPLVWDNKLCRAGRDHSVDMARRNYFSHFSPEGSSVTERAVTRGVDFRYLGENLALDYSVRSAHNNLMRSRGHRENILKREYRRIGIGISVSPRGELLVTQVFSG